MIHHAGVALPYTCEQIFDLAADIERYPEFLKGWLSAQIVRRESNICYVQQVVGFGLMRLEFTSKAVLRRPERIDVTSADPRFRLYRLSWQVEPAESGCRIGVAAEFEMQSGILQYAVNQFLPNVVDEVIVAFEARAHTLYRPRRDAR